MKEAAPLSRTRGSCYILSRGSLRRVRSSTKRPPVTRRALRENPYSFGERPTAVGGCGGDFGVGFVAGPLPLRLVAGRAGCGVRRRRVLSFAGSSGSGVGRTSRRVLREGAGAGGGSLARFGRNGRAV